MRRVTDVMSTVECITMDSLMDVCQWKQENLRVLQMPNDEDISQIKMNKSYSRCRTSFEIFISSLL